MRNACADASDEPASLAAGFDPEQLSAELADAHRTGNPVAVRSALVPPDVTSARGIQHAVTRLLGGTIVGWKVALTPHGFASAPLLADTVIGSGQTWPGRCEGVTGVEIEIALRLKTDVNPSEFGALDWPRFAECLDRPMLGIELVGGRYRQDRPVPFSTFLADNLGNAGYVIGDEAKGDVVSTLERQRCLVEIDGKPVYDQAAAHPNGDPINLLRSCLGEFGEAFPALCAGQILTTGSICGLIPVDRPRNVRATLEGFGTVECRFEETA